MLSYRHAFHAGNHADILKHAVISLLIDQLKQKDKPFCYLDTHSGGGCYDLTGEWANKKAEYLDGIARLWPQRDKWPALKSYLDCVTALNSGDKLHYYPGSPEIARSLLREQDRLILMELHNNEIDILRQHMHRDKRVALHHRDGFEGLVALTPPTPRRGLALIDPPYELKEDYERVVKTLAKAWKRWSVGIYAVWYPLLGKEADRSQYMLRECEKLGIPMLTAELSVQAQSPTWGMHGSGMTIFNPPWQFEQQLEKLLPELCSLLALTPQASWTIKSHNSEG